MRNIYCKMLNCLKYTLFSALWVSLLLAVQQLDGQNIQLSFSAVQPSCNGYTDGTVTVNPTGGSAPYFYAWNNGQTGPVNLGVGAGTVSVTVTDQNGQTGSGSFTLTQPAAVVAAITPMGFSCTSLGGTLQASGTGGTGPYTYTWTGGASSGSIQANTAGAYFVTVTDAKGCIDVESYFVHPPLSLTIEVENIPCFMFCDAVAKAIVTGGVFPYTYLWNTGATTQQIVALPPGLYSVTVTDAAGCTVVESAQIYEPPAITIAFTTVTPACGGATGSVTAQAGGGTPPYTYLWNYNNVVGPTLSNVPAGTYYVQVTDGNGCQKSMPVEIPAGLGLNVSLSIQKASCQGVNDGIVTALVTPATGTYSYQWNIQNANTASLNGVAAGTNVCVTVTDVNTGCQGVACGLVGTHSVIGLQVADTDVNCLGDLTGTATALASNGTGPYTYVWTYPNSSTVSGPNITGLGAGAYSILATDSQGCTAIGVADVGVISTLKAAYQLAVVECEGDSIQVKFTDASTDGGSTIVAWSWNIVWGSGSVQSNLQNPPVVNLPANETGTAQLTVTSAAGCTAFASAPFSVDSIASVFVDVDSPAFNCDGSPVRINVTGDPSYTYTWFPMTGLTFDPGPQSVIANPAQTQIYTLVAGNGSCMDTVQVEVIRQTPLALSIAADSVIACEATTPLTAVVNVNATIQWFGPNGALIGSGTTITVPATLVPTEYKVVATDALGCTQTDSVTVTGKIVSFALNVPPEVFDCDNNAIPIMVTGAPAFTYVWSPTTGLTFLDPPNVVANPSVTTTYTLIGTNGFCADTAQVKVIRQTPLTLSVGPNTVVACATTTTLTATVNVTATIQWFANSVLIGNTPTITVPATATPTLYTVIATDGLGCTRTDNVMVSSSPVSVTLDVPAEVFNCNNDPVPINVSGTPGLSYTWSTTNGLTFPNPPNAIANPSVTTTYTLIGTNGSCADTAQVTVIRVVPIDLMLQDTAGLSCQENQDLVVTINANSNATVVWQPGNITGLKITVPVSAVPVVYTAIATDAYGCTQSVTATVSGHPASVQIVPNTPTSVCENVPVTLTAVNQNPTDVLTYHWTSVPGMAINPSNQPTVTITGAAGNYVITVEAVNQFGCRDSEQIPVSFSPGASLAGQISVRNCGGLTVDFQNLGTTPGTWNFGDGTPVSTENDPTHTYATPGNYTAVFSPTNAECVAPFDTVVQIQMDPFVVPAIASNLVNCTNVAVYTFTGTPANGTYLWNVGGQSSTEQNPTFTFNQAGPITAQLTVTDASGCTGTTTLPLNVDLIAEQIGNDTTVCVGAAVQLNPTFNTAYTYVWTATPADATLDTASPNPTVTPGGPTTYTVNISNGACSVQYTATVDATLTAILDAGPNQVVCSDDPVTLAVVNPVGNNYQWSQSSTFNTILAEGSTIQITPEKNGVYYVRSEAGGCVSLGSVMVDNAEVTVDAQPLNRNLCLGDETQLTITNLDADDQLQYMWSPGLDPVFNPTVSPTSATSYTVTVTNVSNQAGCADTITFNVGVTALAVTAEVTGKDTLCPGQSTTLQATAVGAGTVFTYAWTPAATLSGANTANPTAYPEAETVYTVTATADGLCPQTASVTVYFMGDQCIEPYIFVPNTFTPNGDESNDRFIVRGLNIKELYMVVWDRWGEKVFETSDAQDLGWDGTYLGTSLTPDAYAWYIKATCGNGALYEKKGNVTLLK